MSSPAATPDISIVEVGPRDGLQNEKGALTLADKIALVEGLAEVGLRYIETGSFVNPKWIPQMADSEGVFAGIQRKAGVTYAALTPNLKGFERAVAAGADEVAVFAAASESFSQKNINCNIEESIQRFEPVATAARDAGIPMRGYVSCVAGCPYEGHIAPEAVLSVSHQLLELGCYEVSLGDTIGMGTAGSIRTLLQQLLAEIPASKLALHCHNTYGQALANILAGIDLGITRIDSSIAGLGGCPYAKGASGNVATEDVVYMLHGMGLQTGIDLDGLIALGIRSCDAMGISNQSSVSRARAH